MRALITDRESSVLGCHSGTDANRAPSSSCRLSTVSEQPWEGQGKNRSFVRLRELWPAAHAALGILVARWETT